MRKFFILLKKEIKELLTPQMIVPLLIGILFFVFIGNVIGNENKKSNAPQSIAVLDLDGTASSQGIIDMLSAGSFKVTSYRNKSAEAVVEEAKVKGISSVVSIPAGFEKGISDFKPQQLEVYSIIRNFSLSGSMGTRSAGKAIDMINEYLSSSLIQKKAPSINPADLKNPILRKDIVVVGDKSANVQPDQVTGFISSQTAFVPIILFIIIIFAAQMIAVTIASEKENKTLETLLSTPISRTSLVSAKMIAAGLVSLVMAAAYMIGFRYYMSGIMGDAMKEATNPEMSNAVKQLGLTLDTKGYILLGASLFLSILIALAISLILGAFAEDVKKVQGLIAPITFLIMIPYLLAMFVDLNTTSPALKYFIYAIPFSHPFLASPNLFLHRYDTVIYGILYEAAVFAVLVYAAGRIFSSDKILTMKLNFKKGAVKFGKYR